MIRLSSCLLTTVALLSFAAPGLAQDAPSFTLDGYYRVRPQWTKDPDLDSRTKPNVERFFQHRLRLTPHIQINENISAHLQMNAMDDQIWGANPGNILTQSTADSEPNLVVQRAYGEVLTPVGLFRVGRIGSQWGRGILSNDGDGFRNEFGDAHFGDTYDRFIFITKPMGEAGPLTTALLYDKIIETDIGSPTPLSKKRGDVDEAGIVVNWKQRALGFLKKGWLSAGTYTLYRMQNKTDSAVYIPDVYLKVTSETVRFDVEAVGIFGKSEALTAFYPGNGQVVTYSDGRTEIIGPATLAQPKFDIAMVGVASEIGYKPMRPLELAFEVGYASGDKPGTDAFSDSKLTTFTFDPDYNVGLLMFEVANRVRTEMELEAIRARFDTPVAGASLRDVCNALCGDRTDFATTDEAINDFINGTAAIFGPTSGAVRNALYLFPKIHYQPVEDVKMLFALLWARAGEPFDNRSGSKVKDYGIELDYGIEYSYTENFFLGLQAGVLLPGEVFNEADGSTPPNMYTVQPRFTVVF